MSWQPAIDPLCEGKASADLIETVIVPRARDLGGFEVRRALPSARRQMVGPFIFFDQMGPAEFILGRGLDVRPHPHIGLATVTYLFEGEILHRDSLGTLQPIRPGDVNWMTAGRGIAHSERSSPEARAGGAGCSASRLGWRCRRRPRRRHPTSPPPRDELPVVRGDGKEVRIITGSLYGERSPVPTFSAMFYADASLAAGPSCRCRPSTRSGRPMS